jgi:hypothetical protein
MIGLRWRNVVVAAAAALVAQTLSSPAQARSNPTQAASVKEISSADPTVSASARNRAEASRLRRPCQKVAAYTPILFLGVGW